jgi:hypothetical protein
MMTTQELATIERVDLREIWPNEATDFTPWLAENLSALGEALGLDLELQSQEAAVGGYSLDIFAHDGNGRPVVIENQLGPTDHSHLGQLLTYAAGFDANVTVWIAKEFRDEHREALDLLNHRTDGRTDFFGVEVELWRIGTLVPPSTSTSCPLPTSGGSGPSRIEGLHAMACLNEGRGISISFRD